MRLSTIRSFNDGVAIAEGNYELSGVDLFLGLTIRVTGSFTFRLAKQNGRWMIEEAHVKRS